MPLLLAAAACGGEAPPERPPESEILTARTLGLSYLQEDRLAEAEEEFRKLARWVPDEPGGWANLALVSLRRGEYEEAGRLAREALERAPEDPDLLLLLATVQERTGEPAEALATLERARRADPDHLRARYGLAQLLAGDGAGTVPGRGREGGAAGIEPDVPAAISHLERILELDPANPAARAQMAELLIQRGRADEAAAHLEELRARVPSFPGEGEALFERALASARAGRAEEALTPFRRLHDLLQVTGEYQAGMEDLEGPRTGGVGFPELAFSHEISVRIPDPAAVLEQIRFTDASEFAGLTGLGGDAAPPAGTPGAVLEVADFDADGDQDLFAWIPDGDGGRGHLLRNDLGRFRDAAAEAGLGSLASLGGVREARFADVDGDGRLDLYLVREGPNRLYAAGEGGTFRDVSGAAGVADPGAGRTARFFDADHDGDLDLFVGNAGPDRLYRNDGDGGFREPGEAMGLRGGDAETRATAILDFDRDGDTDLLVAGAGGVALYENLRQARFRDAAERVGLAGLGSAEAVDVGDHDNDGRLDLLVVSDGALRLFRATGDGDEAAFEADRRSAPLVERVAGSGVRAARLLDFDNDGRLDVAAFGPGARGEAGPRGAALLRNEGEGRFSDASGKWPSDLGGPDGAGAGAPGRMAVADYNEDGDLDLLVALPEGRVRLLRNDGADANHHFRITLLGRGPGSGKNNHFGIGSRIEARAGDLYQTRIVTDPTTHFGLGSRLKADVIRVTWTNGVPQVLYYPGTDQDLIEDQTLKGSCAFVYAWDGERFSFVTDAVWRSAIGMPVGIMGGPAPDADASRSTASADRSPAPGSVAGTDPGGASAGAEGAARRVYAPPAASREYVRIPGDRLRAEDGVYRLRLTEELWEVAYLDEVKLVAVDHPDSLEVWVDERFVPPSPPVFRPYAVSRPRAPGGATDGRGVDVLPRLRAADADYVSALPTGPYQGITGLHDLVLDLGPEAARADSLVLFLRGWIFPTDASINVAVAQAGSTTVVPPRLEVPDGAGGWRTAVADLGFPAGKDKTVAVELSGRLDPDDPRVRIRTNMQVYWDHAFFSTGPTGGHAVRAGADGLRTAGADGRGAAGAGSPLGAYEGALSVLRPLRASIRYRGFSREYRKGGRYGPHWFDYEDVSEAPRWLPIAGRYTRYGDVRELLLEADDRYAVLGPGDEVPVEFAAGGAPRPPEGWTRTFFLYTVGWIKDADLNTATGSTVEPLPFHDMSRYPYDPPERFPSDRARRDWLERYQTREVGAGWPALEPVPER